MEEKKITDEIEEKRCEHEHHHQDEDECCGHEHHHHHDEDDECCGHEHHHHHDKDDECSEHEHHHHDKDDECCGHGHHHHHHDEDECCDHDHEHHHHHDHGHKYEIPGFKLFETHNHEGATICSFEKDVKSEAEPTIKKMQECINILEKWLDEKDALIGHVKGYVKEAGPVTTFSTVGNGLNVEKHDSTTICVGFASIVFGPSEEELKDKVAEIFAVI